MATSITPMGQFICAEPEREVVLTVVPAVQDYG